MLCWKTRSLLRHKGAVYRTHEGNVILAEQLWEFGILRCMTPASPHSLAGVQSGQYSLNITQNSNKLHVSSYVSVLASYLDRYTFCYVQN